MTQSKINTANLPPELLRQLRRNKGGGRGYGNENFLMVLQAIQDNGGSANIDEILIGVYQLDGTILKRTVLHSRLGDMKRKNYLTSLGSGTGGYRITTVGKEYLAKSKAVVEERIKRSSAPEPEPASEPEPVQDAPAKSNSDINLDIL